MTSVSIPPGSAPQPLPNPRLLAPRPLGPGMGAAVENGALPPLKDTAGAQQGAQTAGEPAPKQNNPVDQEAFYHPDHARERAERQARRDDLKVHRNNIEVLPINHCWEIPGRPSTVFSIRDYTKPNTVEGRRSARDELPFLFKAFESGQQPPPRPGTKRAELPRAATIHEYLDWTVTASDAEDPDELDFGGFRVLVLIPRFRLGWPPPTVPYNSELPLVQPSLGAPLPPVPHILVHQKPICAATFRAGPTWLEVPFYATQETRRNKGYGRALLEAIEDVCRLLKLPRILLCSTDDPKVKGTWQRLGFSFTTKEDLERFGVTRHDLLHMDNTVQMHKDVPPQRPWKPIMVRHGDYRQRVYYLPGGGGLPPVPMPGRQRLNSAAKKPSKPPKKRARKR